jgi:hypothetical protein
MFRQWVHDFFFTTRLPLMWELWLLIAIKLAGLMLIHHFFFSNPIGPSLNGIAVAAHLITSEGERYD